MYYDTLIEHVTKLRVPMNVVVIDVNVRTKVNRQGGSLSTNTAPWARTRIKNNIHH